MTAKIVDIGDMKASKKGPLCSRKPLYNGKRNISAIKCNQ